MSPRIDLNTNEFGAEFSKRFAGAAALIYRSGLSPVTRELVSLRTSQINGCGMCVDMHTKEAVAAGESEVRLHLVAVWRETTVFTEPERAALALAEEGTRLGDANHGVSDETWARVREHYDEDRTAALVTLIALTNAANRMGVITRTPGGAYQAGMAARVIN